MFDGSRSLEEQLEGWVPDEVLSRVVEIDPYKDGRGEGTLIEAFGDLALTPFYFWKQALLWAAFLYAERWLNVGVTVLVVMPDADVLDTSERATWLVKLKDWGWVVDVVDQTDSIRYTKRGFEEDGAPVSTIILVGHDSRMEWLKGMDLNMILVLGDWRGWTRGHDVFGRLCRGGLLGRPSVYPPARWVQVVMPSIAARMVQTPGRVHHVAGLVVQKTTPLILERPRRSMGVIVEGLEATGFLNREDTNRPSTIATVGTHHAPHSTPELHPVPRLLAQRLDAITPHRPDPDARQWFKCHLQEALKAGSVEFHPERPDLRVYVVEDDEVSYWVILSVQGRGEAPGPARVTEALLELDDGVRETFGGSPWFNRVRGPLTRYEMLQIEIRVDGGPRSLWALLPHLDNEEQVVACSEWM